MPASNTISPEEALSIYPTDVRRNFEEDILNNDRLHYPFSRVRALGLFNSIAPFVEPFEVSNAG